MNLRIITLLFLIKCCFFYAGGLRWIDNKILLLDLLVVKGF